jgi:hypothetical protein
MKKLALPFAFFSFFELEKKISWQRVLIAVIFFLAPAITIKAQQVIGSFPEMEGGFESATTATRTSTTVATGVQLSSWTGANTSSVPAINTTIVRTGAKSLQWTTSSTSHVLFSKTANSTAIANSTSYVVQYYWWKGYTGSARPFTPSISPDGTAAGLAAGTATTLGVSATSFEWTKQVDVITTGSSAASPRYGLLRYSFSGGSFGTTPGYLFDDFCIYPGSAADVTAPGDVTSPVISAYSSTSLTPSWTAPAGGVDGGGYVVIRYTSNPSSEPPPNVNGIYAVGSALGTGTVVYIGTATSFVDGSLSSNTAYYYKVYAVDKAFNYSSDPTVFAGFTGIAGPTALTFTTPSTCITDRITISWTGPLNYNSANNTLLGFIKAGSAVTTGTPTNALSSYTASTTFGTGTAYQNDASAFCIINGDGTNSAGDHSGITITGLTPGTTYHLLLFNVVNVSTSYSSGSTGNGTTLNSLAEPANNPTVFAKGAVTTSNIPLTWTAAAGSPSPTGYLLKASNAITPADPTDFTDPADQLNIAGGTANAKTSGNSYSSFTNFSAGTMYYFRINSYTNTASCINFKSSGPAVNVATLPNAVTSQLLSITGGTGSISWSAAAAYNNTNHTTLVFVSSSAITAGTPTINPSAYTANTAFGAGTAYQLDANAKCVYKGDGNSATVTGLVSGSTYYVLILTVVDAGNYDATHSYSAYATTSTPYNATFEYTWQGGAAGSWSVATNWNPNRNTTSVNDVLIFNTAGNVTVTNVTEVSTIAKLSVNAGNVTLQSASAFTLTITHVGVASTDFTISGGASLTLGATVSITLGSSTTASIVGTLSVNSGNTYNSNGTSVVTTVAGRMNNYGTVTSTTASKFIVNGGGTYNHGINGGTIPTGTWNTNSTCLITGTTSTQNFSGHRQTFSNFVWDCAGQSNTHFVLGENSSSTAPTMIVTDSFVVKRTNGRILQLSSTGGQRDFVFGNFFQYGGNVAITYNTDASGEQRSLTVTNTFYVTDSIESNAKFQIINNPGGQNIVGRLFVGGNIEMHPTLSTSTLERIIGGSAALAEVWFNGSSAQYARFSTIAGSIDFVNNHTGSGVTLLSNATTNFFKLLRGTFFISSNTLTINNAVSYPTPGTGTFGGSSASNLIMGLNGNAGTLNFANGSRTLKDFTQMAGNTTTLGTELAITAGSSAGRDSLGAGATLITNDNLILRSDANGTARLARVTSPATTTITGKVTVERYLPMGLAYDSRRWRLISAPFKAATAPTIQAAWQEGTFCPDRNNPSAYDPKPGYGTHITVANVAANGFDQGSQNNPSIFHYSKATASNWKAPGSSTGIKVTDSLGVYMLFVRGDRSIVISTQFVAAKPTTLDPKGDLYLGDVSVPLSSSGFHPVGNPYASQIKLDNVDFNGTLGKSKTIYLWDPKALGSSGVGAFITCSGDGGSPATYTYTGNSSNYASIPGVIESSGAFMVAAAGGNVVFHESDKTITSSTIGVASRPSPIKTTSSLGKISKLHIDLIGARHGEASLADGIAVTYNKHYSNDIDEMDAIKMLTFSTREKLSITKNNGLFSIERRQAVTETDTIQLHISKLNKAAYQLAIRPVDFDNAFTAYVEDNFTKTSTPFALTENSSFNFDITSDSLSSVSNRFSITFKRNKSLVTINKNLTVFPNPVVNGKINIQMNDMPAGEYNARVMNSLGQVICSKSILHQTGTAVETIDINNKTAKGIYRLEIIMPGNTISSQNVLLQ